MCYSIGLSAQVIDEADNESNRIVIDTIPQDTLMVDSILVTDQLSAPSIISKDAILDKIIADAQDSTILDQKNKKMYLYGDAVVKYQSLELKAGLIVIDYSVNEAMAYPKKDSLGKDIQIPHFKDKDNEFTCDQLRYNFDTKKGMVYEARTQENDLYVLGPKTKFISKDADSTAVDDILYTEDALVTSCDAEHPHFGILASKLKVIPGKVAIVGPSYLQIMDVPLVPIPFGFFPMNSGRSTGLIKPDFNIIPTRDGGIRVNGIGWYFPINDKLDLQLRADFSSRGDWLANVKSDYNVRYKYNGSISLTYAKRYEDNEFGERIGSPTFAFNVQHRQHAKAHPYRKISGSVDISTSSFYQKEKYDVVNQKKNTYKSNFGLSYQVPNSPLSFNLDMAHEQNTNTKKVTIDLPRAKMRLNTIFPFKRDAIGANKESWYEKINFSYNSEMSNKIIATDTTLFESSTIEDMQTGMKQHAQTGADFKIAKFFNLNFNVNYDEYWSLKSTEKSLLNEYEIEIDSIFDEIDPTEFIGLSRDTLQYGVVDDISNQSFSSQRDFSLSTGLSWKWYGTLQRKKGFVRGLRHTISPRLGLSYNPDTKAWFEKSYVDDLRENVADTLYYSPFEKAVYKASLREKGMNATYGFGNLIEAKYYSKKDTTLKKLKIFNSIGVNGSYNFAADSLNWSQVSINASTPLLWGWSNLTINGRLDPYKEHAGKRVNTFVWEDGFKLPEIDYFSFSLSTGFKMSEVFNLFTKKDKSSKGKKGGKLKKGDQNDRGSGPNDGSPGNQKSVIPANSKIYEIFSNLRFSHNITYLINRMDDRDTSYINIHSVSLTGKIPISSNWDLNLSNLSYDFQKDKINYPQLGFTRKLHCWSMSFSWTPNRDSFSFNIEADSNTLGFLKKSYGKNRTFNSGY